MNSTDTGIQPWISTARLALLLDGQIAEPTPGASSDYLECVILAGRMLRSRETLSSVRRAVRAAVPRWMGRPERLDAVVDAVWSDAEGVDSLCASLDPHATIDSSCATTLIELRDDVESLRRVLSVTLLALPPEESSAAAHATLTQLAERIDDAIEPLLPALLAWSANAPEPQPWLLEFLEPANPWWLDLIDPVMRGARAGRASSHRAPSRPRVFEHVAGLASTGGSPLALSSDAAPEVRIQLRYFEEGVIDMTLLEPPHDASADKRFELSWETDGGQTQVAEFVLDPVFDLRVARADASLSRAVVITLRQGDLAWSLHTVEGA